VVIIVLTIAWFIFNFFKIDRREWVIFLSAACLVWLENGYERIPGKLVRYL
jgi:hypothetical protein